MKRKTRKSLISVVALALVIAYSLISLGTVYATEATDQQGDAPIGTGDTVVTPTQNGYDERGGAGGDTEPISGDGAAATDADGADGSAVSGAAFPATSFMRQYIWPLASLAIIVMIIAVYSIRKLLFRLRNNSN